MLHKRVAGTFRKTASNFHYEFNIRHMAGSLPGHAHGQARSRFPTRSRWRSCGCTSRSASTATGSSPEDLKKYKELALEQAKKFFKEMSPTTLMAEPLIFCHFAQGVGDKIYDRITTFADLSGLLTGALDEYNETTPS